MSYENRPMEAIYSMDERIDLNKVPFTITYMLTRIKLTFRYLLY